jgi:hypothetical protein
VAADSEAGGHIASRPRLGIRQHCAAPAPDVMAQGPRCGQAGDFDAAE